MRLTPRLSTLLATAVAGAAAVALLAPLPAVAAGQPEHVRVINTAHRGAMGYAPENTLAAFQLGVDQRADLVEADVQRTKDGVLVLMHDTTLTRTTDVAEVFPDRAPWRVSDFTYAEIQQLDAGSWFSEEYAGEPVPTMAQMVELIRPRRSGILMEVKSPALYPGIEQQIADEFAGFPGYVRSAVASQRLVVQSFDWESMARYHQLQPSVPVGLLGRPDESLLPELATWADQINPSFRTFDAAYVEAVHDLGMEVHTYTVNRPEDMHLVLDWGVDGVITNVPDVLHDVLAQRRTAQAA
ncbi:glycerophosphodiester phosphodiesterase family protein [Nocardioides sp.]|uniref:glycerophosphodiester phosphodiesterase n=1 Tax=Nocardioides sp. TaxID=35761 RepID=UPI00273458B8|nr:glycerophosphodiester phosphodiesterase family protein [Nocardioides sp.]MDP3890842.1 glycerophosphodiester phosphodiesterase family protein [Nocardioides sp.]